MKSEDEATQNAAAGANGDSAENQTEHANEENEENEEEEEYEEVEEVVKEQYSTEDQAFDFEGFVIRFASGNVCSALAHLFKRYRDNSDFVNHCVVKMFHRIAFDLKLPAMLFHVSILRVFQSVGRDRKVLRGSKSIEEMYKFGKFLLGKSMTR